MLSLLLYIAINTTVIEYKLMQHVSTYNIHFQLFKK